MPEFFYIGIGAALGGMMRLLLGKTLNRGKDLFPRGTFLANTLGSFAIGFLGGLSIHHLLPANYHLLIATGFCGALTTFSTFSLEIIYLINRQKKITVLIYIITSALLCLALSVLGIYLGGKL